VVAALEGGAGPTTREAVLNDALRTWLPTYAGCRVGATAPPSRQSDVRARLCPRRTRDRRSDLGVSGGRRSLVDHHVAVVLLALVEANVVDALASLVTTAKRELAVRATILLGNVLRLLPRYAAALLHAWPSAPRALPHQARRGAVAPLPLACAPGACRRRTAPACTRCQA